MAWPALQTLVAASLLAPMVVMAQREVVISVSYDGTSKYNLYHIGFSISLFTEFHECLSKGILKCVANYGSQHCPNCIVETVRQSGQSSQEANNYYKCINNASSGTMNCHRQTEVSTTPGIPPETYRLEESSYPSICFGFVWTFDTEDISLNSDRWGEESCGDNCSCPSRGTTPHPGTATTSLSSSPSEPVSSTSVIFVSSTPITQTSSPSSSSTPSVATQGTSSTKTPTEPTTDVLTVTSGSPSTESSSSTEKSSDDPPIAVIVGAVVGVIAVIIIIIIIVVICRKRKNGAKSSDHDAGARGKQNDRKSHSHPNTEFSENSSELHSPKNGVIKTNGNQNSVHQPSITKDLPKPQFAIKDNDSDFGYSKAQLVVPEDNNTKGKKSHDNYDYVYAEDGIGVPDQDSNTTRNKITVVSPPKVKYDYTVIDITGQNKDHGNDFTDMDLANDYNVIPEEDYGYSHAEGGPSAQDTNVVAVDKDHVTVPKSALLETSDLHQNFGYEYSQASDGYTTVGNGSHLNLSNDYFKAKNIYSRLHEPVRDIQNPYDVGLNTNDVYSKLHEEVRDIKNPYNVLPEPQVALDSSSALPDTANSEDDTEEQIKTT